MSIKRYMCFLIVAMIIFPLLPLAASGQKENVTISDMIEANTNEKLFEKSNSILYILEYSYGDVISYRTKDFKCHTNGGDYYEAYLNGRYYCSNSGECYAALGCFPMPVPLDEPFVFNQDLTVNETIVDVKTDRDHLVLTTEVVPEKVRETMEYLRFEYAEGASITYEYTLDAKTLLFLGCDLSITDSNGSIIGTMHSTLEMDAKMPEQIEILYNRITSENQKELTIVLNPGTEDEETYNSSFVEGEGVLVFLPEGYNTFYTDAECTQILGSCDGAAFIEREGILYSMKN